MKQSSEGLLSQPQIDEHVAETKGLKKATKAAQKRARHEGTEAKSYSWSHFTFLHIQRESSRER